MSFTTINVKVLSDTVFVLNEDLEMVCAHEEAYLNRACCDGRDCDCRGVDSVVCPAEDCTGITPSETDQLFERLS